jgi:chromatin remodeling complex protein RSC6
MSDYNAPLLITDKLCKFMGVEVGTKMSRNEVYESIYEYINVNNLRDCYDKYNVILDDKLYDLLEPNGQKIKYYENLRGFLKKHFILEYEV